jgi:hypothetical protein
MGEGALIASDHFRGARDDRIERFIREEWEDVGGGAQRLYRLHEGIAGVPLVLMVGALHLSTVPNKQK